MNQRAKPTEILLSSKVSVARYRAMEASGNRAAIAAFVWQRFAERYIESLAKEKDKKNGFAMMALSCLMIEALESFHRGWDRSNRKSRELFRAFLLRNAQFGPLSHVADDFY